MRLNIYFVLQKCMERIMPKDTETTPGKLSLVEKILDFIALMTLIDVSLFEHFIL
jgi:hypothetical protein